MHAYTCTVHPNCETCIATCDTNRVMTDLIVNMTLCINICCTHIHIYIKPLKGAFLNEGGHFCIFPLISAFSVWNKTDSQSHQFKSTFFWLSIKKGFKQQLDWAPICLNQPYYIIDGSSLSHHRDPKVGGKNKTETRLQQSHLILSNINHV